MTGISEILCLATAIFFEARSEPLEGQILVAETIMTRVQDSRYPDTVCEVVFEPAAFSFTHDGLSDDMTHYDTFHDKKAREESLVIAEAIFNRGPSEIELTHYHTTDVSPFWAEHYTEIITVGAHVFYYNHTPWK